MAFIRPDLLRKSLDHLASLSPEILYVSIDGPRNKNEEALVEQCRAIALNPGWNCEIVPLFRDNNIGLAQSFVQSMEKMFSEHEFGIFLEDDVLLSPTFLNFAEEIFIKYRNNDRVGHINASNFNQDPNGCSLNSYYFSEYTHVWGFGTWRRMWKKYDLNMKEWKSLDQKKFIRNHSFSLREGRNLKKMFDLHCENPDPWACDYQWQFNILYNHSLAITPAVNMSINVGFEREDSTHTKGKNPMLSPIGLCSFPLKHPSVVERSIDNDKALAKKMCPSYSSVYFNKILNKINLFS